MYKNKMEEIDTTGKHKGCGKKEFGIYECGTYINEKGYDYTVLCLICRNKIKMETKISINTNLKAIIIFWLVLGISTAIVKLVWRLI